MENINEGATAVITVDFKDEDGDGVTPSSASYILYDKFSGVERIADDIDSLAESVDVVISGDNNNILDENNKYEIAVLFVEFTYNGGSKVGNGEYSYKIINMAKV